LDFGGCKSRPARFERNGLITVMAGGDSSDAEDHDGTVFDLTEAFVQSIDTI